MARSIWKGPYLDVHLFKINKKIHEQNKHMMEQRLKLRTLKNKKENNKNTTPNDLKKIKIWSRRSIILPSFIDHVFHIYNGRHFVPVKIHQDMVGHKFGDFSSTRRVRPKHKNKT